MSPAKELPDDTYYFFLQLQTTISSLRAKNPDRQRL